MNYLARLQSVSWLALWLAGVPGCGWSTPPATVEGTVRLKGEPLDNCLVTFLPDPERGSRGPHSKGITDDQGRYRLRREDQREGAAVGRHRVVVQDLSVCTGVRRRDHGTVDREADDGPPPPVRASRVPETYSSAARTPLSEEVVSGHQTIDLELK